MGEGNVGIIYNLPDSKVHGANMGPTWVLSAPDGPHVAPWTLLSGLVYVYAYILNDDVKGNSFQRDQNCHYLFECDSEFNRAEADLEQGVNMSQDLQLHVWVTTSKQLQQLQARLNQIFLLIGAVLKHHWVSL